MSKYYDIRRRKTEVDSVLGGIVTTSTAIETRHMELQNVSGEEIVGLGGVRLEANYRAFSHKDTDIKEGDVISADSGTTNYEVVFVEDLLDEHKEFFLKRKS